MADEKEKDDSLVGKIKTAASTLADWYGGPFHSTSPYSPSHPASSGTITPVTTPPKSGGKGSDGEEFAEPKDTTQEAIDEAKAGLGQTVTLGNNADYEWRKINGLAPEVTTDIQIRKIDPNLLASQLDKPIRFNQLVYRRTPTQKQRFATYYRGPGLVDANNQLARHPYGETDSELIEAAGKELMKMNTKPWDRLLVLRELKRVGFYGRDEISNIALNGMGFMEQDSMAMARFLDYSQKQFRIWEASFGQLARVSTVQTDSGRRFTPYSDADMGRFLREASFAITGRAPTKKQLQQMLLNSVAMQRRAFAVGTDSPDISTVAQTVVATANPQQKIAYGLGNAISRAFMTLGK